MRKAIARGVSAYQGDIDEGLADYPDKAFDYVILSQTLQETRAPLEGIDGDAARGPPGDHFVSEFRTLDASGSPCCFHGQAPKTKLFPYDWYNSPNIHFLSINDFEDLCREPDFPSSGGISFQALHG